jgi:hypothetical protein
VCVFLFCLRGSLPSACVRVWRHVRRVAVAFPSVALPLRPSSPPPSLPFGARRGTSTHRAPTTQRRTIECTSALRPPSFSPSVPHACVERTEAVSEGTGHRTKRPTLHGSPTAPSRTTVHCPAPSPPHTHASDTRVPFVVCVLVCAWWLPVAWYALGCAALSSLASQRPPALHHPTALGTALSHQQHEARGEPRVKQRHRADMLAAFGLGQRFSRRRHCIRARSGGCGGRGFGCFALRQDVRHVLAGLGTSDVRVFALIAIGTAARLQAENGETEQKRGQSARCGGRSTRILGFVCLCCRRTSANALHARKNVRLCLIANVFARLDDSAPCSTLLRDEGKGTQQTTHITERETQA